MTFKDIFKVHLKYTEYLIAKTLLTHQYTKNIKQSGGEVEDEIRAILRNILPQRFKVTHGYILSSPNQTEEPKLSPQSDVIIVDTLVPHSLFIIDAQGGMEVVPVEAVVGIFEIKRTLTKESLSNHSSHSGALYQLRDIIDSVGIKKNDNKNYMLGVGVSSSVEGFLIKTDIFSNPIIGVLSINRDEDFKESKKIETALWNDNTFILPELDIIGSLDGFICCTCDSQNKSGRFSPKGYIVREENSLCDYQSISVTEEIERAAIISYILGFIQGYISFVSGRLSNTSNYFFNHTLGNR